MPHQLAYPAPASDMTSGTPRPRLVWMSVALIAFVFVTAALGVWLAREARSVAPLWLANAGALAFILRFGAAHRSGALMLTGLVLLTVNLLGGQAAPVALSLAALNIVEIVVALAMIDRLIGPTRSYATTRNLVRLIVSIGVCAPIVSAGLAAVMLYVLTGAAPLATAIRWYLADAIGMIVLAPILLTVRRSDLDLLRHPPILVAVALAVAATASVTALVFSQPVYPLLFLIPPMLVFAAFRLRFAGTALAVATVTIIAVPMTAEGYGPIAHNLPALGDRIIFLQAFLAVAVLSALPIAATLAERARLIAEVTDREKLYRLLADHTNDMIVRIGLDGMRRYISPACRTILGYEPEDLVGNVPSGQIHVEDRARVERVCRSLLDGADAPVCTYRQRRRDGDYAWLEATYRLVRDADTGEPTEFVASVRDVGKRHSAQLTAAEAIAAREESLRLLTMAEAMAGVGHWRLDLVTGGLFWSSEVFRIHGRHEDTPPALSQAIHAYHPEDREMVQHYVDDAVATGGQWRFQARIVRPNGEIRHIVSHGQAERDPGGAVVGIFGVFQDVTDRVRSEQLLIEARDAARAATVAKSAFLATMSHEIRTPMTGVLGMIELLRGDVEPAERDQHFTSLTRSAEMLMKVLDDVLDFSKLESRSLTLEAIDFDLHAVLGAVVTMFRSAASQKGLSLEMTGIAAPLWLRGDPVRLQQIVSNLVSNAVKFTDRGSIRIVVDTTIIEPTCQLRIAVIDTGIGVAPADQGRLFHPFVQADASTTRRFGGTGLGLAITRQLVEAMHGEIWLESATGAGATFWLEIVLPTGSARSNPVGIVPSPGPRRAVQVLVAEDNAINRTLVSTLLSRAGHVVSCVENGAMAVEITMTRRFDLILMDMQMPVMDGVAATRAIRAGAGPSADAAIVALTADASVERRDRYRDIGLTAFLTKPIDTAALTALLDSLAAQPAQPIAPTRDDEVLDEATIARLESQLGHANAEHLLSMLRTEARDRPARIARLVELGDAVSAQVEAHGLRGAASSVGAFRLAKAAAELEDRLARNAQHEAAVAALLAAARRTLAALEARTPDTVSRA